MVFTKKFYLSCIANVGFGFDVDCFAEKPSSFEEHAGQVYDIPASIISEFFPSIGKFFGLTIISKKFSNVRFLKKKIINSNQNHFSTLTRS